MPNASSRAAGASLTWPMVGRAFAANLAAWTAVSMLHALSAWSDAVHRGQTLPLGGMLYGYALAYAPFVPFGSLLYLLHRHARAPWRAVALANVLFVVLELAYQAILILSDTQVTLAAIIPTIRQLSALFVLLDIGVVLATNAVVFAIVATQARRRAAADERRLSDENLQLRLALEQQRLQGLRAQLEPHFLHNALNAIAGLVRSDDRALALTALQQLSRMLRYATTAIAKDWVPLADEVAFLREYLGLQQLRFGPRLEVRYVGLDDLPAALESPPLLLQPLAENAIRHGLERSELTATITVHVAVSDDGWRICVSNNVPTDAASNPGLGVGLATMRARLAAAYRGRATLVTQAFADRFDATLLLPMVADD